MNTLQQLEEALKNHDWTYQYANGNDYYKGRDNADWIRRLKQQARYEGLGKEADALYEQYRPEIKPQTYIIQ